MHYSIVYWSALAVVGGVLTLIGAVNALTTVSASAVVTVLGGLLMTLSSISQLRLEEWGKVDPEEKRWHALAAVGAAIIAVIGLALQILG